MGTYSKYQNTDYNSLSSNLILIDGSTQSYTFTNNYVYTDLLDNTSRLIAPKAIRDSILSVWDSNPFKVTSSSNSNFIGVDTGNPSGNDLKDTIFFGKRDIYGDEIMSDSLLLNRDNDIYFYNTKKEGININQSKTRLSFLSGTNSSLYLNSPYIQSQYIQSLTSSHISFDLINNRGDINILSRGLDYYTGLDTNIGGSVSLNGINLPTIQDSQNIDGKILILNNGGLEWTTPTYPYSNYVGVTGSELNLYGNPLNVNGYSMDFTDHRQTSISIGDLKLGTTFDNKSIFEVLNRIIYDYIPPKCELVLNSDQYLEVGTSPTISLSYKIYKNTNDLLPTRLINMIPSQFPPISSDGEVVISGEAQGVVIVPLMATQSEFTVRVDDGYSYSEVTKYINPVYPYFYGFVTQSSIAINDLNLFSKKVEPKGDKTWDITGSGYFYFIYDKSYGVLSSIYDYLGNNITASFSQSVEILSSPNGWWQSKEFYVYKHSSLIVGPPSEFFQFKY